MPVPPHLVVVGAGISGLAAAHRVRVQRPDVRVTVLEAAPTVGGKLAQDEVAGLTVDTGAESVLNRRPEGVDLIRQVGLDGDVCHPATTTASVWTRGRLRPLPPSVLGVPADLRALARSGLVSRAGVARAAADRLLPARPTLEDVAVGRFVARRLGHEVSDRLVEPLLGGVYAGHADRLSLLAAAPQIAALAARGGSLLAAAAAAGAERARRPSTAIFAGLVGGVGRLPAAVAAASGAEVRCSATVRELGRGPAGWRLVVGRADRPEVVQADAVILATPPAPTARLLSEVAPAGAAALREVETASVAVVTLALPATGLPSRPTGSGFLVPPVDGRAVKALTWSSNKWAWVGAQADAAVGSGTVLLRASVGRHGEGALLQRDDADLIRVVAGELQEAVGLRPPVIDARVTRWGGALPQYTVGHLDRVVRIRSAIELQPGLDVCGAGYDGVGIAACVADAQRAADRAVAGLRPAATMAT